jgi:replicative DNA helicase
MNIDRSPSRNVEAERCVLGSILLDNAVLHKVIPRLRPEDFYRDVHRHVYRAICNLYEEGELVDVARLSDALAGLNEFETAGGISLIAELMSSVPHAANAKYYAAIVRDKSIAREIEREIARCLCGHQEPPSGTGRE